MSNLTEAALKLAGQGLPVFPCKQDKTPLISGGFKGATTDPDTIRRVFSMPASKFVAVPTGEVSGIVVVDLDVHGETNAGAWYEANAERLPETRCHDTPTGGRHLLFKAPDADIRNSAGRVGTGVDIRGNGGYFIVPPSPGYAVASDVELAEMPEWLVEDCLARKAKPSTTGTAATTGSQGRISKYTAVALAGETGAVLNAPEGSRNDRLNTAAVKLGSLVASGALSRSTVDAALTRAALAAGLGPSEIEKTIRSGIEHGMKEPREIPEGERREAVDEVHPAEGLLIKVNGRALEARRTLAKRSAQAIIDELGDDNALRMFIEYAVSTAYSPQPFLALGAALCLVGALAGRRYASPGDTRTNLFVISLADSGSGKDQARRCIKSALGAAGLTHYLGGEDLASTQSIYGSMGVHPARIFPFDEFGHMLAGLLAKNVAGHKHGIISALTKIWSSASTFVPGTEYAKQKGRDGNPRVDIQQPHVCIYGTTVASTLWTAMHNENASDGSLARYLVFQTNNNTPELNHFALSSAVVPIELQEKLKAIAAGVPGHDFGGNLAETMDATIPMAPYIVPYGEGVPELIVGLGNECLSIRRQLSEEHKPGLAFVARIAEHTMRLALVCAIARNPAAPVIEAADYIWAEKLARHCSDTAMNETASSIADSPAEADKNRIVDTIKRRGKEGMTKSELTRATQFLPGMRQRDSYLADLLEAGRLMLNRFDSATKKGTRYFAAAF